MLSGKGFFMRTEKTFDCKLTPELREQLTVWGSRFREMLWLDSNDYPDLKGRYQAVMGADAFTSIRAEAGDAFDRLAEYRAVTADWMLGYLTYDLKNEVEALESNNFDGLNFPDLQFFQPKRLLFFGKGEVTFSYLNLVADEIDADWAEIQQILVVPSGVPSQPARIRLRTTKDQYHEKVVQMLEHIQRGDIYEANFCQEFFAEETPIDPIRTFHHLNTISKPPFASFLKIGKHYAMSASPERYLSKKGTTIVSQPIKGTAKRLADPASDAQMIERLQNDPKERSENVMITDLVRNDLSRLAQKGSVQVDELCAVYSFLQVHQLISTVRCEVAQDLDPVAIIAATFPMGSMTGAPKVSAMKIIEELEDAKRGLYSGAIGYFDPKGDFDFNVIIRSILYNEATQYVSFSVGGAITAGSHPELEYEECLVKAKAMREVLES